MKNFISLFVICISLSLQSPAQTAGSISGKVIDSLTNHPVDYATVSIYKTGLPKPINGAITDGKGIFSIHGLQDGEYSIQVDFIGYRPKVLGQVAVRNSGSSFIGNILLSPSSHQLADITISGKAPVVENKVDKLVYNAENDLTSQGGVAIDILRKVPMVSVDVDGNVELQGNSNVRFLINGKPSSIFGASLADALQTIPASQIKSIEVITSPGAKYDMEGTAGIINIVLKQTKKDGLNGNGNVSAGTRLQNGSFNINTRKGSVGVNAFFSGTYQLNSTAINTFRRRSLNDTGDTVTNFNQNGTTPFIRNGYQSGIGLTWNTAPRDELSGSFSTDNNNRHGSGPTDQDQQTMLSSGQVISDILSHRNAASHTTEDSKDYSLAYKKTFKKEDQELDVLYTSSYGRNNDRVSELTSYPDGDYPASGLQSNNPGRDHETDISLDYAQPVTNTFSLQTGVKAVIESINNSIATDSLLNSGAYTPDPGLTYDFAFKRSIYAAYVSTSFKLFKDFLSGEAGMRYERTITTSDFADVSIPSYNLWAPSFLLQHPLNEKQFLKFAYSYRVERPDYEDLSPFLNIQDPHDISTGNPLLKTEIGHKYELGYSQSFKNGNDFYAGLFYNYNSNDIQSITTYYPVTEINGTTYYDLSLAQSVNIGSQTAYGASLSGSLSVSNKLSLRSDVLLRELVNAMPGQTSVTGFTYKLNVNATYQIRPDLTAEVFGNYTSRRIEFHDSHPAFLFYTAAVKKQFNNKRASLGITATNAFNRYVHQLSTNDGTNFTQNNLRQIPLRSFGITFAYKFGKTEKKDKEAEDPEVPSL